MMRYMPEFRGDDVLVLQVLEVLMVLRDPALARHICHYLDHRNVVESINALWMDDTFLRWTWHKCTANIQIDMDMYSIQKDSVDNYRRVPLVADHVLFCVKPILSVMGPMNLTILNMNTLLVDMNKFFCWMRQLDNIYTLELTSHVYSATMEELVNIFQIQCKSIVFRHEILDKTTKMNICHFQRTCQTKTITVENKYYMDLMNIFNLQTDTSV